jgi:hypothetical protein
VKKAIHIASSVSTNVFCLRRARSVRYWLRKLASRIRRFRYICGGEDGRRDVGSDVTRGGRGALRDASRSFALCGGGFAKAEAATSWTEVFGAGAPLTTWSRV